MRAMMALVEGRAEAGEVVALRTVITMILGLLSIHKILPASVTVHYICKLFRQTIRASPLLPGYVFDATQDTQT